MFRKIFITLVLFLVPVGMLVSYGSGEQNRKFVGIAMPTKSTARWVADGNYLKKGLEENGYRVDLQYAENVVDTQISQIENMITKGVNILIIASVDGSSLTNVLEKAKELDIPAISYDRLILNTPNINYYVTFDNFTVGVLQAKSLLEGLRSRKAPPWNVELFGLSPDDNNAYVFYDGAMSILQPYIDDGSIILQSGQEGMDKVAIPRGDSALTQARMDNLIAGFYTNKIIDGVLSPYDGQSIGVISSVKGVGYGSDSQPMPIITGQDCELPSVKAIISGEQYSSIFKDTRELAKVTIKMVDSMFKGEDPEVNDRKTYNNGTFIVPSNLLKATIVTKDNLRSVLVDSGYYKESDVY